MGLGQELKAGFKEMPPWGWGAILLAAVVLFIWKGRQSSSQQSASSGTIPVGNAALLPSATDPSQLNNPDGAPGANMILPEYMDMLNGTLQAVGQNYQDAAGAFTSLQQEVDQNTLIDAGILQGIQDLLSGQTGATTGSSGGTATGTPVPTQAPVPSVGNIDSVPTSTDTAGLDQIAAFLASLQPAPTGGYTTPPPTLSSGVPIQPPMPPLWNPTPAPAPTPVPTSYQLGGYAPTPIEYVNLTPPAPAPSTVLTNVSDAVAPYPAPVITNPPRYFFNPTPAVAPTTTTQPTLAVPSVTETVDTSSGIPIKYFNTPY